MNPELTATLAARHSRELTTRATARHVLAPEARPRSSQARPRSSRLLVPRYRVTWTRVSLALADGGRRRTSWTIVISATRAR
jgi:hypothetical protein